MPTKHTFASADVLRTSAILAVFIHHSAKISILTFHGGVHDLTFLGTWGVDCFFVLTGYLLSRPYLTSIINNEPLPSVKYFLTRRFLRIYPLYFVCLIASSVDLTLTGVPPTLGDIITHVFMIHNFSPSTIVSINGPLWTMALDAQFYVLLPLVAVVLHVILRGQNRTTRINVIWLAIGATVLVSILERLIVTSVFLRQSPVPLESFSLETHNIVGMASEFALGIAFAQLTSQWSLKGSVTAQILVALGVIPVLTIVANAMESLNMHRFIQTAVSITFRDLLGGCVGLMILWILMTLEWPLMRRWMASVWMQTSASLAYGIYLFHYPILQHVSRGFGTRLGSAPMITAAIGVLALAISILVAIVVHRLIERPFLNLRERARDKTVGKTYNAAAESVANYTAPTFPTS